MTLLSISFGTHNMKIYVFSDKHIIAKKGYDEEQIIDTLVKIAKTTNTGDLVVAIFLHQNDSAWGGMAYNEWFTPPDFHRYTKRKWILSRSFEIPKDLPQKYKLIRMRFGVRKSYPKTLTDSYGWRARYRSFTHHLANVFAHELHHFRRYHLGLHPGEGEQSACRWALEQANKVGFKIIGGQIKKCKPNTRKKDISIPNNDNPKLLKRVKIIASRLSHADLTELGLWIGKRILTDNQQKAQLKREKHFERLRMLPAGAKIKIKYDDSDKYIGQIATKIRTLKRNSTRMVIRTNDGQSWRWPMYLLDAVD